MSAVIVSRIRVIAVVVLKSIFLYRFTLSLVERTKWYERYQKGLWESKALQLYSQFIEQGSLCFDIGANKGNRTAIFRRLGARVVAVEPLASRTEELRRRYFLDKQVFIVQKAVGSHEGEVVIAISTKDDEKSSCSTEWRKAVTSSGKLKDWEWDSSTKVYMTTLDQLIQAFGKPSFCKIDVEGFEYETIKGLSHNIKAMSIEFHAEYLASTMDSIRRLAGLGLARFNYSMGESMEFAVPNWVTADQICATLEELPDKLAYGDVYATI